VKKETRLSKLLTEHGLEPAFTKVLGLNVQVIQKPLLDSGFPDDDEELDPTKTEPGFPEETPLKQSRVVDESSSWGHSVVFVGMAPAKEEVRLGEPFVGKSGMILRTTAKLLGYQEYYLTNTLLCEIPDGVDPMDTNRAIFCCSDRLVAEIKDRKPDLVVTFGNMPLNTLLEGGHKISEVAGHLQTSDVGPLLPVLHPAALLRVPEAYRDFADQLNQGLHYLEVGHQTTAYPEVVVANDENFSEILNKLDKYEELVLDIETTRHGLFPYNRDPDGIRCIAITADASVAYIFPGESSTYYEPHPDYTARQGLKDMLRGKKLITHNGQFDLAFLLLKGYTELSIYYDTMLAHIQMDERTAVHGLKHLAHKYLGVPDWESDIRIFLPNKKSSFDLIPDERLYTYAACDVAYTYQLYKRFKQTTDSGIFRDLIIPCANMFTDIRHRGLPIDTVALAELDEILDKEYQDSLEELAGLAGWAINPASPQEVAQLLYDEMKLPVLKHSGRSTDKSILNYFIDYPAVRVLLECRQLLKLRSTYVAGIAGFVDYNHRIHPFTKLYGTVTGRLSTQDPSIMNITKKRSGGIKKMFLPEPGHYIVEADQKQMELRCYVAISHDEHLRQLLTASLTDSTKDPHYMVAALAFGPERAKEMRLTAKTGVFGKLYGGKASSFATRLRLPKKEAGVLINTIESLFPSLEDYNEQIRSEIHSQGYLESFFGRRRRFPLLTEENRAEAYRQGANFKVQSMASDVNLFCLLHLYKERKRFGVTPYFPVHDSIVFDVEDLSVIGEVKKELETYSRELVRGEAEFAEDVHYGKNWGELLEWKV
jgi:uracil-DNA glycosylase family 4